MPGKGSLKTIIVMVILLLVGVLGVLGMNTIKTFVGGATADFAPENVLATPAGDGAVITWKSLKPCRVFVEYGSTPASLLLRFPDRNTLSSQSLSSDHRIEIANLKGGTNYYFRIRAGESAENSNEWEVFDNNGIPYSFKTKGEKGTVAAPTVAEKPVLIPTAAPTPATGGNAPECKTGIDYNNDGRVNALDMIVCRNKASGSTQGSSGKPGATTPTVTVSVNKCSVLKDYNGDGTINSLDKIKCLQSQ
jgi:hypothetical protein